MSTKKYYSINTRQEEFLYKFIERVGCMSFWQARYILSNFYGCNESQAEKVIMSLGNKKYFRFLDNNHYLIANSLLDNSKLDMNMILALGAALEKCNITQEIETITSDGSTDHQLSLIASNNLYYVLKLPDKDYLPKLFIAQNNYNQTVKVVSNGGKNQMFGYTTLLVFSDKVDIDATLDTIVELDLNIPHEIYFAKPGNMYEEISYERFAESPDDEEEDDGDIEDSEE